MNKTRPLIGVGIIIENEKGEILIAKRLNKKAAKYSIAGGAVEEGETFEEAAIREVKEETNLTIKNPQVIAVTNNLETYREEGWHTVSIILLASDFEGTPGVMEPEKSEEWFWCNPQKLPEPHFDASRLGIECYLENRFYKAI